MVLSLLWSLHVFPVLSGVPHHQKNTQTGVLSVLLITALSLSGIGLIALCGGGGLLLLRDGLNAESTFYCFELGRCM